MTNKEAINYNKNLREYMRITDKLREYTRMTNEESDYKFLQENYEALDMGIKALEQTKWIPCSEKLPEETTRVLIYTDTNEITFGVLSNNHWRVFGYKYVLYDGVLAWMPLPQPYEGE